ncbi:MAG: sulfite exporter TauE/SafE family protein [Bacteroidia bacterium]|nr:sulfite exporter TauE/SafE family protein [Bacteroidia bacterium]
MKNLRLRHIGVMILVLKLLLVVYMLAKILPQALDPSFSFDTSFYWFVLAGIIAQTIDATLGMGYGVSCSTLLLSLGIPPRVATASVHTSAVFTAGVSGLAHLRFNNIDKQLFVRLVFTGVLGAVAGAYLISNVIDGHIIKPYISGYLLILGCVIVYKGSQKKARENKEVKRAELLALVGGFLDAIGGGGWGPIVTSNIINQGKNPRHAIGTVNTAEFFVAFFGTGIFLFFVGIDSWQVILGLMLGGVLAAPIGAFLTSKTDKLKKETMMIVVGSFIILISAYTIYKSLH